MSTYVIGDVQGCFNELQALLKKIQYNPSNDKLWFVGDLVNRGPQNLETIQFIRSLPEASTIVVLGNHDLHLLACLHNPSQLKKSDTLGDILKSSEATEIETWLRKQKICHYDSTLNVLVSHAGVYPLWTQEEALQYANEFETLLCGNHASDFIKHMYGNEPAIWSTSLGGMDRARFICNAFTRMRFLRKDGSLLLTREADSTDLRRTSDDCIPWFNYHSSNIIDQQSNTNHIKNADIIFGHWAALNGITLCEHIHAIDTGCVWGNQLTAMRCEDKMQFSVNSQQERS